MNDRSSIVDLIERKKLGGRLSRDELTRICGGYVSGELPDYQIAAWLMAVRLNGLDPGETLDLTLALVDSGSAMAWSADRPVVDKHSTGGVGDKTSIALVPLLASAGLIFVKMSGRGLGHTGGTLDKLESIPGFEVELSPDQIRAQVNRIGCALVGQTDDLVPADRALYALRDVTSTVDSIPLIASSIMSKKLAGGAKAIVLDVKYGSGALIREFEEAAGLARAMVEIGSGAGRRIRAVMSPMNEPLGYAVGNALEVQEAIDVLRGEGPDDFRELTLALGSHLMVTVGATSSLADARGGLEQLISSGAALEKFGELIEAQGGDRSVVDGRDRLPRAPVVERVRAPRDGWVDQFDARQVAEVALSLGAGRRQKGDSIDPRTGVRVLAKRGGRVKAGDVVAEIHAASEEGAAAARAPLLEALRLADEAVASQAMALEVIQPRTGDR